MGIEIENIEFTLQDFERFSSRLRQELEILRSTLNQPGFGRGAPSLGAELELHLVDADMRPAPRNEALIEQSGDPRVTLELNRYNLEFNANPCGLAGTPFASMREEFEGGLDVVDATARELDVRVAMIGTLPTLKESDLRGDCITPRKRYHALSKQLRSLRGEAFDIRINGPDSLSMRSDEVTLEGACTSWQLHLRIDPQQFADHYNAAQLATSVVLAVSGNSPFFVGQRLWEETRIAVFKQSVDPRPDLGSDWRRVPRVGLGTGWVRKGALELFEESVALHQPLLPVLPKEPSDSAALETLRLHHGTIWSWNRAVFDPALGRDDAHLRIELRAMAAGPTLTDMLANSAFALGLTLGLAADAERWMPRMPFEAARHNLYRGAQQGLKAKLLWPEERTPSPTARAAGELALSLLPTAARGLASAGVDESDYAPLLEVIEGRVKNGQTGAAWQAQSFARYAKSQTKDRALARMLEDYLGLSKTDTPVHKW